jgi:hypothetical protein
VTASDAPAAPTPFQEQAQWMELLSAAAVGVLALNLVAHALPPIATVVTGADASAWSAGVELLRRSLMVLPSLLYLAGLWTAHEMFARMGKGEVLTAENAAGLGAIGASMAWGAAAALVISPTLLRWTEEGFRGLDIRFEGPELVILVLGGSLFMLGRVMRQAVALKAEVDAFV